MSKEEIFKFANMYLDIQKNKLPIAVCDDEIFCRLALPLQDFEAFAIVQRGTIKEIEIYNKNNGIMQTVRMS